MMIGKICDSYVCIDVLELFLITTISFSKLEGLQSKTILYILSPNHQTLLMNRHLQTLIPIYCSYITRWLLLSP